MLGRWRRKIPRWPIQPRGVEVTSANGLSLASSTAWAHQARGFGYRATGFNDRLSNTVRGYLSATLLAIGLHLHYVYCEAPEGSTNKVEEQVCLALDHKPDSRDKLLEGKPIEDDDMKGAISLVFHSQLQGQVQNSNSTIKAYSIASYAANDPIEDRYDVSFDRKTGEGYVAVFDGHGGWQASDFARQHLLSTCASELSAVLTADSNDDDTTPRDSQIDIVQMEKAFSRAFERVDRDFMLNVRGAFNVGFGSVAHVGSCALVCYVKDDILIVSNAGDIRAVLGRSKTDSHDQVNAVALSTDHNAKLPAEKARLATDHPNESNIVKCKHPDACYVKGRLQPTRSLGDFYLKYSEFNGPPYINGDRTRGRHVPFPYTPPYITAVPETKTLRISAQDRFVVLGSDGLWDYLSNQEAIDIVQRTLQENMPEKAAPRLIEAVLKKASAKHKLTMKQLVSIPPGSGRRTKHDDTTVVVVYF